jgi:hypothetical protein
MSDAKRAKLQGTTVEVLVQTADGQDVGVEYESGSSYTVAMLEAQIQENVGLALFDLFISPSGVKLDSRHTLHSYGDPRQIYLLLRPTVAIVSDEMQVARKDLTDAQFVQFCLSDKGRSTAVFDMAGCSSLTTSGFAALHLHRHLLGLNLACAINQDLVSDIVPTICVVLASHAQLLDLNISGNKFITNIESGADHSKLEVQQLAAAIVAHSSLEKLTFGGEKYPNVAAAPSVLEVAMTEVDLSDGYLGPAGIIIAAAFLSKCTGLSSLNLANNGLVEGGAKEIAAVVMESHSLTSLDISRNFLGPEDATCLAAAVSGHAVLTALDVSGNQLCEHTSLSQRTNPDMSGIVALMKAIETSNTLTDVNISNLHCGGLVDTEGKYGEPDERRLNGNRWTKPFSTDSLWPGFVTSPSCFLPGGPSEGGDSWICNGQYCSASPDLRSDGEHTPGIDSSEILHDPDPVLTVVEEVSRLQVQQLPQIYTHTDYCLVLYCLVAFCTWILQLTTRTRILSRSTTSCARTTST